MTRHSPGTGSVIGGACKVRKRLCSSSSSASSVLHDFRFKRAILVGKRGRSALPSATWKMNAESPSDISAASSYQQSHVSDKGMQAPVSARKLASALWELSRSPQPHRVVDEKDRASMKKMRGSRRVVQSAHLGSLACRLSDPSHSASSEMTCRSRATSHKRIPLMSPQESRYYEHNHNEDNHRDSDFESNVSLMEMTCCSRTSSHKRIPSMSPQKSQYYEHNHEDNHRDSDFERNAVLMESETCSRGHTPINSVIGTMSCLKDLKNGFTTSKELIKLLSRIGGLGDQHSSSISLISALRGELRRACAQVDHLIQEQTLGRNEISFLKKQFLEEKSAWKRREQERRFAVHSLVEELESEKKLRRRAESVNKKLAIELAKMRTSLLKAVRELESERRSREIIELVCNELTRGVEEDKAEAEELKRESVNVLEELEKEREMLQIADEWREERVHMKLSEAKFQLEEKNLAVEQLRNELETFLTNNREKEPSGEHGDAEDQSQLYQPNKSFSSNNHNDDGEYEGEVKDGEEADDGLDSEGSDLHSIELNMYGDGGSHHWSYGTTYTRDDSELPSVEKKEGGITSYNLADSTLNEDMNISRKYPHLANESDRGRPCESVNTVDNQAHKLDQERYASVKGLRERMLACSWNALLPSSTHQWSRPQAVLENQSAREGDLKKPENSRATLSCSQISFG